MVSDVDFNRLQGLFYVKNTDDDPEVSYGDSIYFKDDENQIDPYGYVSFYDKTFQYYLEYVELVTAAPNFEALPVYFDPEDIIDDEWGSGCDKQDWVVDPKITLTVRRDASGAATVQVNNIEMLGASTTYFISQDQAMFEVTNSWWEGIEDIQLAPVQYPFSFGGILNRYNEEFTKCALDTANAVTTDNWTAEEIDSLKLFLAIAKEPLPILPPEFDDSKVVEAVVAPKKPAKRAQQAATEPSDAPPAKPAPKSESPLNAFR